MSPEAIHSLIGLFGVERGLHILNFFAAVDDVEIYRRRRARVICERSNTVDRDLRRETVEGSQYDT